MQNTQIKNTKLVHLSVLLLLIGGVILTSPTIGYALFGHPIGLNQDYRDVNYNYFIVPVLHIIAIV
jgi:hypothetical protein